MEIKETNQNLKSRGQEEVLEISSTGYGYESVTKDPESKQASKETNQSCGGL